jgi:N-acetylmuramoyl-L-alanine amidase
MQPDDVKYIVVHCSATPASMDVGASEIDRWHRARGWLRIGYHAVIRRDGTVEMGRALDEMGAHALGYNDKSVAVCLVGGIELVNGKQIATPNFTPEQYATLSFLLVEWTERFPHAEVLGHRDLPNVKKDCPSFDVRSWMRVGKQPA